MSSLSATARVILALLKLSPLTGYDIKRTTDVSTRYFWRASYGQIYPELQRLEQRGLVTAREQPHGRRRRKVYELTAKGERALSDWLHDESDLFEFRDEGLLRLFFGDLVSQEELLALVRRRRQWYELSMDEFRGLEAEFADRLEPPSSEVLRYGIELMAWNASWWADLEERIGTDRVG
jgi:PadR family transcriptional regulator, regulatory protein AphA